MASAYPCTPIGIVTVFAPAWQFHRRGKRANGPVGFAQCGIRLFSVPFSAGCEDFIIQSDNMTTLTETAINGMACSSAYDNGTVYPPLRSCQTGMAVNAASRS